MALHCNNLIFLEKILAFLTILPFRRFGLVNAGSLYIYFSSFQQIDEEEYGGAWELTKEGFTTSLAGFLVSVTTGRVLNLFI